MSSRLPRACRGERMRGTCTSTPAWNYKCRFPSRPAGDILRVWRRRFPRGLNRKLLLLDPLYLDPAGPFFRLGKIVFHLQSEPYFGAAAESLGKPYGHFRRNSRAAIHQIVEGLSGHAEGARSLGHGESERFEALLPDDAARMGRVLHTHGTFS